MAALGKVGTAIAFAGFPGAPPVLQTAQDPRHSPRASAASSAFTSSGRTGSPRAARLAGALAGSLALAAATGLCALAQAGLLDGLDVLHCIFTSFINPRRRPLSCLLYTTRPAHARDICEIYRQGRQAVRCGPVLYISSVFLYNIGMKPRGGKSMCKVRRLLPLMLLLVCLCAPALAAQRGFFAMDTYMAISAEGEKCRSSAGSGGSALARAGSAVVGDGRGQ